MSLTARAPRGQTTCDTFQSVLGRPGQCLVTAAQRNGYEHRIAFLGKQLLNFSGTRIVCSGAARGGLDLGLCSAGPTATVALRMPSATPLPLQQKTAKWLLRCGS